jgi:hypothetical protein
MHSRAVGIGLKALLRRRKLLIFRSVTIAKSRKIAEARYTLATHARLTGLVVEDRDYTETVSDERLAVEHLPCKLANASNRFYCFLRSCLFPITWDICFSLES